MEKRKYGFTLTELLVVCVILGFVVVIAVPRFMDSYASSRLKVFDANIKEIKTALENYKTESGINAVSFYPLKLDDLQSILVKTPINPYTNKSMLSSTITEAGIFYKPIDDGANYILVCTQEDIDDIDHDNNTKEAVPCNETINHDLLSDNWQTNGVIFTGTGTIAAVATASDNSGTQTLHKQIQNAVLLFHIRADNTTQIGVSLNEHSMNIPVSTEWQKYAVVYNKTTDTIQIQFNDFPIDNNVYIKNIILLDK